MKIESMPITRPLICVRVSAPSNPLLLVLEDLFLEFRCCFCQSRGGEVSLNFSDDSFQLSFYANHTTVVDNVAWSRVLRVSVLAVSITPAKFMRAGLVDV